MCTGAICRRGDIAAHLTSFLPRIALVSAQAFGTGAYLVTKAFLAGFVQVYAKEERDSLNSVHWRKGFNNWFLGFQPLISNFSLAFGMQLLRGVSISRYPTRNLNTFFTDNCNIAGLIPQLLSQSSNILNRCTGASKKNHHVFAPVQNSGPIRSPSLHWRTSDHVEAVIATAMERSPVLMACIRIAVLSCWARSSL